MHRTGTFKLVNERVRDNVINFIRALPVDDKSPLVISIQEMTRTLEQNAKMWPLLTDLSKQVIWDGEKLSPEDWKVMITALLSKQKCRRGIEGGLVFFGQSTRTMSKKQLSEVIEAIYWFGAEQGVTFSEKSMTEIEWSKRFGEWKTAA